MNSQTIGIRFLFSIFFISNTAHSEWVTVRSKGYQRVVMGKSIVVANSPDDLLRLDLQGNVLERLSTPLSGDEHPVSKSRTGEKILDDFRFRDIDYDSQRARTLLEKEQTLVERRQSRIGHAEDRAPLKPSFVMALDGNLLWTASSSGVFEWSSGQPLKILHGPFGGNLELASSHERVLFAAGMRLIFFDLAAGSGQELPLAGEARRVTFSASGRHAAWLVGNQITWWHESSARFEGTRSQEFAAVSDMAFCGETLLILKGSHVAVFAEDGTVTTQTLPQAARHVVCHNQPGSPWVLLGKDLLLSADGGSHWQVFPLPPFNRIRGMAATPTGALISSSEGLHYCDWSTWSTVLPARSIDFFHGKLAKPRISWWKGRLPRLTVHSQFRRTLGKQDFRTLLFATFPLDEPTYVQVAASQEQRENHTEMSAVPDSLTRIESTARELPCLHRTRRKAIETFLVEPERARSYLRRSAHAAWLPELRMMVDRRFGRSESLDYVAPSSALPSPLGVDTVNDVRYEARATWDLARLIFSPEEIAAQSQAIRMAEQRRDLESNIHRLFFERQRLQLERVAEPLQVSRRSLRLQEITADLDALSGNTFSECLIHLEQGAE